MKEKLFIYFKKNWGQWLLLLVIVVMIYFQIKDRIGTKANLNVKVVESELLRINTKVTTNSRAVMNER